MEGGDESDEYYDSDDSTMERRMLVAAGSTSKRVGWPYIGVDPRYDYIDYSVSESALVVPPFVGSISGTHLVYDNFGNPLASGYFDLSSFSIGAHHKGSFISLPVHFTELYQQVRVISIYK